MELVIIVYGWSVGMQMESRRRKDVKRIGEYRHKRRAGRDFVIKALKLSTPEDSYPQKTASYPQPCVGLVESLTNTVVKTGLA
ncbi:MAG: hypothetical protein HY684_04300 [Chloroflexi bacterium]|nr:hypothetical protein [Chloroflexota bacterium]